MVELENVQKWRAFGSKQYIEATVKNFLDYLKKKGEGLSAKALTPMNSGQRPRYWHQTWAWSEICGLFPLYYWRFETDCWIGQNWHQRGSFNVFLRPSSNTRGSLSGAPTCIHIYQETHEYWYGVRSKWTRHRHEFLSSPILEILDIFLSAWRNQGGSSTQHASVTWKWIQDSFLCGSWPCRRVSDTAVKD